MAKPHEVRASLSEVKSTPWDGETESLSRLLPHVGHENLEILAASIKASQDTSSHGNPMGDRQYACPEPQMVHVVRQAKAAPRAQQRRKPLVAPASPQIKKEKRPSDLLHGKYLYCKEKMPLMSPTRRNNGRGSKETKRRSRDLRQQQAVNRIRTHQRPVGDSPLMQIYRRELAAEHQLERVQLEKQHAIAMRSAEAAHQRECDVVMQEWTSHASRHAIKQTTVRCKGIAEGKQCRNTMPYPSTIDFCKKCMLIIIACSQAQGCSSMSTSPGRSHNGDMAGDGPSHHRTSPAFL